MLLLTACAGAPQHPRPHVSQWGGMREVLREGRTQGRVALDEVARPDTWGVGALEGLRGEVTVAAGEVHVATGESVRPAEPGERAALLVAAEVEVWSEHVLDHVPDLAALEARIASLRGDDRTTPLPFRVLGRVEDRAGSLRLHVLDGSCPIADPGGRPPWRYSGEGEPVELIGFHAESAAGRLTHHGRSSHVHALVRGGAVSGHVDAVALGAGARLFLAVR